jgi:hypothetical protein
MTARWFWVAELCRHSGLDPESRQAVAWTPDQVRSDKWVARDDNGESGMTIGLYT